MVAITDRLSSSKAVQQWKVENGNPSKGLSSTQTTYTLSITKLSATVVDRGGGHRCANSLLLTQGVDNTLKPMLDG